MKHVFRDIGCVGLGLVLGLSISLSSKENTKSSLNNFDYPLLQDVIETVETYYVKTVSKEELVQAAIKGIFEHLDPYSSFLNHQEFLDLKDANRGEYFGFGFEVASNKNQISIIAPFANSPAEKAGIRAGDTIIKLNNTLSTEANLSDILAEIKQHSLRNQPIDLTLKHLNDSTEFKVSLRPSMIIMQSVSSTLLKGNIGYIRLSSFQENSTKDVLHSLSQWQSTELTGLILDLRNNPGGLLDQAIKIADIFLAKGRIVSTSGRFFDANSDYYASPQTMFNKVPILVLINKGSASAAEVLAAALQENGRAKLLGETSFGKGTVQSLIPILNDGNAVKLTIAQYNTPKGGNIHEIGIVPDVKVNPETSSNKENMAIIDANSTPSDVAHDYIVNSAIAWIQHHDE
ncbi:MULTISPECIES: S41 family peptidase [Shewanella]|uniref:Carboxyl-terminal protease n=2 Tax=Shewanella putrefaciens TaxID=24 RepID=E6XK83_SHEP2|nr:MULTISPECIES: S41 family peptidase [Shewanella]CAD6365729.1 Carboxy-terminal processing protease CtpB [Shewanella hafniensis]MCA1897004.1 S41 family peptidase [Shewanella putrefaciens]MCK7631380.1 S41 family peptidase [Shewanella sp. JNE9-1]MCK7646682.1 S41 family peptidase [Shewanella sp. JNE3-1]MCK7654640.1 S41 family peptidase [Shewanella sp. JNE4-1]